MIRAIYYFYYRLFDMHSRGEDHVTGAFMALFTSSLPIWLNIFSIIALLRKIDLFPVFFSKTVWLSFMVLLFVVDYFLFVHRKKYEKIIQLFKDEPKAKRRKGSLLVLLYILISVVFFIFVVQYRPGYL